MPIDIIHELRAARMESTLAPVPRENCHLVLGDPVCRPSPSTSSSHAGTATQNQAKRFMDDAREAAKVGRLM